LEFNSKQLESYTQRLISLSDGTTTNVIGIQIASSNQIAFYITNGSVLQFVITTSTPAFTLGTNVKIAAAYKANDFVLYVNGVQIGTVTSGTVPATSQLKFAEANGTYPYNGNIKATALWKTRLTDDQLEELTGEGFDTYELMAENYNYTLQ